MEIDENIVKGKTIYFTGQFELGPQYRAEQLGATIVKSMSEDVDWVVLGTNHSSHQSRTGAKSRYKAAQ